MSLQVLPIASLPVGIKNGVGGLVGRRLYAGLGSAGKHLFFYDLDTPALGWQQAPLFPGLERNDAVAVTSGNRLYVFSGAGIEPGNCSPSVLSDGYYFDVNDNAWGQVEASIPVGLLGASGCEIEPEKLLFFGGYNKSTFDDFLSKLSQVDAALQPQQHQALLSEFMSQPIEEYGWNGDIWQFDTRLQRWSIKASNPFAANCGAGLIQQENRVTLIEGEVKPGLRSLDSKQFTFHSTGGADYQRIPAIAQSNPNHEGIAGGFAGLTQDALTVAGGAYFVGSQDNYRKRQWYSHQGLKKHYSTDIWRFDGKRWQIAGQLSQGLAYGVAISVGDEMYVIGGEDNSGAAQRGCCVLTWSH